MKIIILLLLIHLFLLISCKDELVTDIKPYDLNKIQNDIDWVEIIDTQYVKIRCLNGEFVQGKYFITDSIKYLEFNEIKMYTSFCKDYSFPDINFNKFSLIGCLFNTKKADIQKFVFINQHEKNILLKILVKTLSNEWDLQGNDIWILIPKINTDYRLITDITEI